MKKMILISSIAVLLASCGGSDNGQLIGVQDRPIWNPEDPYGMVFIPQGSFNMGPSDQDVPFANVSQSKTVSVGAFYMDETEITNNEYRQFITWVRDSLIRKALANNGAEMLYYSKLTKMGANEVPVKDVNGRNMIDWDKKIRAPKDEAQALMFNQTKENAVYLDKSKRLDGRKVFDATKFIYEYKVINFDNAAIKTKKNGEDNRLDGIENRTKFQDTEDGRYVKTIKVNIYPDTLTWSHDYSYSFNESYTKNYFWHPAFDDYPVVGVNWHQAKAFAHWRTQQMNKFLRKIKQPTLPDFRLPTESEWEYAARGGLDASPYPWGGPYTRNMIGCFLANFKPLRGNYIQDGGLKAIKVASYNPNKFGLYDMAGNVAEWTSNAYDESAFSYSHDMNMDYHYDAKETDANVLKRKSIRGGSWKDIAYFIQTSTRSFEYQDTAKSYIGFRCAVDFLGRDKKDFE
tara:strand:- start:447 stop:1823 length:1377 start_codon:yes stop_codon:yes gene_type:complete